MLAGAAACVVACAAGADTDGAGDASFGPGGGAGAEGVDGDSFGTVGAAEGGNGTLGGTGLMDGTGGDEGPGGGDQGQVCQDGDGDGFGVGCPNGADCDDENDAIYPGAPESCDGIDENCNDEIDDGCMCPDDGVSGDCGNPTDLGPVNVGEVIMGVVGNVPAENSLDWYTISFPTDARPGEGMPRVEFEINTDEAFVFDVVSGECEATGAPCTSGGMAGVALGLTEWTFVDDDPGCCTPPTDSMVPWPNPMHLRVYRTTMGPSCATYQLRVTR